MSMSFAGLSALQSTTQIENDVVAGLARWIAEQISKLASKAILVQRLGDNSHQTVGEFDFRGDPLDTHALAEVIYGTGLREAHTLRSSLTYVVLSVRADGDAWIGRYVFRVDVAAGAGWLHQTDIPAERALIGMLMSHADTSARLSLGHSQSILEQYRSLLEQANANSARLLAQAQARINTLEARELEALELRDKLQSLSREREMQSEELKRRHELRMSALEKVGGVAPLIFPQLARAIGGGTAEPSPAPDAKPPVGDPPKSAPQDEAFTLLQQFIASLSDKQFQSLTAVLDLSQIQTLSRLYDIIEVARTAAASAAPNVPTTPPTDSPRPATQPQPPHSPSP
jgi:hypothetical protein